MRASSTCARIEHYACRFPFEPVCVTSTPRLVQSDLASSQRQNTIGYYETVVPIVSANFHDHEGGRELISNGGYAPRRSQIKNRAGYVKEISGLCAVVNRSLT